MRGYCQITIGNACHQIPEGNEQKYLRKRQIYKNRERDEEETGPIPQGESSSSSAVGSCSFRFPSLVDIETDEAKAPGFRNV